MRILAVYRGLPWPRHEGYHLRLLALAEQWAKRHEVFLLGLIHEDTQEQDLQLVRELSCFAEVRTLRLPRRSLVGRFRTNFGLDPVASLLAERPGFGPRLAQFVQHWQAENFLDVAWVFDPWADIFFQQAAKEIPTLVDICDSRSLYYERRLHDSELGSLQRLRYQQLLRRFRGLESAALESYPVATAVSHEDREALLGLNPSARIEVIPNGVDVARFSGDTPSVKEAGHIILFGNMDFLPNSDAALYFAKEIFPLVLEQYPKATFSILGTNPEAEIVALASQDGVNVLGEVADLRPWLAKSAVSVAPIRFGAGIKNKVLESAAAALPVVCSGRATASLHEELRRHLLIADDPRAFANHVVALLDRPDAAQQLGQKLQAAVREHHTWQASAEQYENLFLELST